MSKHIFNNQIIKNNKATSNRPDRVAKEIKVILSDIFAKSQIRDPLLFDKMILISEVFITSDLSLAKIYISPWEMDIDSKLLLKTLNKHIPFFRHKITKALKIKVIPNLIFLMDDQFDKMDEAREMFKLIEENGSKKEEPSKSEY